MACYNIILNLYHTIKQSKAEIEAQAEASVPINNKKAMFICTIIKRC